MRRDLAWHAYDPPTVPTFADVLMVFHRDEYGCFFG
jgi:hypothetical protein